MTFEEHKMLGETFLVLLKWFEKVILFGMVTHCVVSLSAIRKKLHI